MKPIIAEIALFIFGAVFGAAVTVLLAFALAAQSGAGHYLRHKKASER